MLLGNASRLEVAHQGSNLRIRVEINVMIHDKSLNCDTIILHFALQSILRHQHCNEESGSLKELCVSE